MISSNLDYPLKAPSPDTVPLGVRASTYPLWGDMNIQFVDFPTSVNNHGPVFAHWQEMEAVVVAGCVKKGISPPGLHLVRGRELVVSHPSPAFCSSRLCKSWPNARSEGDHLIFT